MFTFFFFNDTATTEIYTLSLHDALPIFRPQDLGRQDDFLAGAVPVGLLRQRIRRTDRRSDRRLERARPRSEEHTSELQSRQYLVCRLLLEKKKPNTHKHSQSPHHHHQPT